MTIETILFKSNRRMKKIILLLSLSLASIAGLMAQPGFYFSNEAACQGESFCVDVTVDNFSNITGTTYQVRWNPDVIQYDNFQMATLPGFTAANIDASAAASGILTISWSVAACNAPGAMGVTLDDCFGQCRPTIFKLCFIMLSNTYGESTTIGVGPNPYVTKDNSSCLNVGLINNDGIVVNCVRPVELIASQREGNSGDLVCVDFRVIGFDDLNSMQFTINYDSTVLNFENVIIPGALPNLSQAGSFGTPPTLPEGTITVSWSFINPQSTGITLLDSTVIFQVCFRIVGDCETASLISFGNDPTPIEFGNTIVQNFNIMVLPENGRVQVSDCNPTGMPLIANCGPDRNLGETFCVEVTSQDFFNVAAFNYLVEWNPAILRFENVVDVTTNGISNFNVANSFITTNVQAGVLGVNWVRTGNNNAFIPNGTIHYRICFTVIGVGGNSPVLFTGQVPLVQIGNLNAPNIGINPTNCEVVVNQPSGVTLTVAGGEATLNEQVCVDISASNFTDITRFRFSLNWDPLHLQFVSIQSLTLPGVVPLINFNQQGTASGSLSFDWSTMTPVSRDDGTPLFRICFVVIGQPGDCEFVSITDEPLAREAVTAFSNGNNVGIAAQDGQICSLFPEGFFMTIGNLNTFWRDTVCVPFRVASFDNITEAHFDVSFNPNQLQLTGIQNLASLTGLSLGSFNTSQANVGLVEFDWTNFAGGMLPDSTVLFELCFAAIGDADGACHPIEVIREPAPGVLTTAGLGSLIWRNGSVCVADKLILVEAIITPVSCPGANDGQIELVIEGGRPPYGNTWQTEPLQFGPLLGRNLAVGQVIVITRDNNIPATTRIDTFFVPLAPDAPTVDAGPDIFFPCDGSTLIGITGQGSQGPDYGYQWTTLDGQLAMPDTNSIGLALRPGIYIFAVTNRSSACTVRDTVNVLEPDLPIAEAGDDLLTTCLSDTVTLNGSLSSAGDTVSYLWTASNGGAIAAGDQALASPRVIGAGTYALEVRYTTTGCIARDTVLVADGAVLPTASGGADPVLGCNSTVTLDGSASSGANDLAFSWRSPDNTILSNTATYETGTPGTFILVVEDLVNGCIATDTVTVSPTADVPVVNAGPDQLITCDESEITFSATVSNSSSFDVEWTSVGGGALVPGTETSLNARTTTPGTYVVSVRDLFNFCVGSDTIIVEDGTVLPMLAFNQPDTLTCDSLEIQVSADVSTGDPFQTRWYFNGSQVADQGASFTASEPGFYTLEVINIVTGCVSIDSIQVFRDLSAPTVGIAPPSDWTCTFDTIPMSGIIISGEVPGLLFEWESSAGEESIVGSSVQNPVITAPGVYTFRAINPFTGCAGEATATVEADSVSPTASAGMDREIGCGGESVFLSGSGTAGVNPVSFAWIGPNGNQITTSDTITVSEFGSYIFQVIDQVNGCVGADTVQVLSSTDVPDVVINAQDTLRLDCNSDTLTLPGQISFAGDFTFEWIVLSGGQLIPGTETSQTPRTITGGFYVLRATNTSNLCFASDTVVVIADREPPVAMAGPDFTLNCTTPSFRLSSEGSAQGPNITYNWYRSSLDSLIAGGTDAHIIQTAGTYILEVINSLNGCVATDTAVISQDGIPPQVSVLTQSIELFITCTNPEVTANIAYTPADPEFNIEWTISSPTGNFVSISADSLSITVDEPGIYTIRVINPENGCVGENEVVVELDTDLPDVVINATPGSEINCTTSTLSLNGSGSSTGPDFSYEWNAIQGGPLNPVTPLQVTTGTPGIYELVVTDNANGCINRDTIEITENRVLPTATIAEPQALSCLLTQVLLNANGSSSGTGFNITWNGLDGGVVSPAGNPLQVNISTGGRYELVILNTANGCEARDTVTVQADINPPVANAGADREISCNGTNVTLDGTASGPAGNITFAWSAISGGGPINGTSIASPVVNTAGTYQLIVTDNVNGCRDTATVMVRIAGNLPDAMAGEDEQVCGGEITLNAILPSGVTGRWTSLGSAVVSMPASASTTVSNAQPGDNRFVWTLSTAECLNYSADTITISVQRAPVAGNDQLTLASGQLRGSVNMVANDQLFGAPGFVLTVLTAPTIGQVDSIVDGVLFFSVAPGTAGQDQLRYQICNSECPDLCATAFVQINVEKTEVVYNRPNAITPNGDGLNDELIFEQLLLAPDQYPNNELIIFNRWNDIVFRASPYLNDWRGANQSGQELPQGTYYYILRLNISEGEILVGDVTVVR